MELVSWDTQANVNQVNRSSKPIEGIRNDIVSENLHEMHIILENGSQ